MKFRLRLIPYLFMCVDPIGAFRFRPRSLVHYPKLPHHSHLKDCFTRTATGENDFSAMLFCNTVGEGKTEARSFLLSFTHEWFKEAVANACRNSEAIIDDIYDYVLLPGIERDRDAGVGCIHARRLKGVEQQVVQGTLDSLAVHLRDCFCRIAIIDHELDAFRIRMCTHERNRTVDQGRHKFR